MNLISSRTKISCREKGKKEHLRITLGSNVAKIFVFAGKLLVESAACCG